jgi:SSS family transporter
VSSLDWSLLIAALTFFVGYGLWRSRGRHDVSSYLVAGRRMPWFMVGLSVMATQASAITFLSTPGQGFADGLRFVQFYFGLPLAMIVLCVTAVPIYHRLKVFTAYEYLESRFDGRTRTLAAVLFLIQRGLGVGLTIYAPALVLSVILGLDIRWTVALLGGLAVAYTIVGGSRAVSHTQALQFTIIIGTMGVAAWVVASSLPQGLSFGEAAGVAGTLGRLNALELKFDPNDRYNLWSGLLGGFFLQLSYFGADQSQVGRYLTGGSIRESRLGLLCNAFLKVPMQLAILSLGVLVFLFYLFVTPPMFFHPAESAKMRAGPAQAEWNALDAKHAAAAGARRAGVDRLLSARRAGDEAGLERARGELLKAQADLTGARGEAVALLKKERPEANPSDTNYVFLTFVLAHLPTGLIGLVFAAVFAASMNSTSAELNALTSTTVVDIVHRVAPGRFAGEGHAAVTLSRFVTAGWALFAVGFASFAARLGSLIEAVNILGSLFYGTILGIFLAAFYLRKVQGPAVFVGAVVAEAAVLACFLFTKIGFLWYNLIGCVLVLLVALAVTAMRPGGRTAVATA